MTIKQTIEKSVEGGWKLPGYEEYEQKPHFLVAEEKEDGSVIYNPYWFEMHIVTTYRDGKPFTEIRRERIEYALLDTNFWKCLGQIMKWDNKIYAIWKGKRWLNYWHKFIDKLASGGSAEDFFKDLLST